MGWPQLIYLGINILSLGMMIEKKQVTVSTAGLALSWICITLPLLYWGGFFS